MNTEMTPKERRAEARTLADTLRNDDLLREEVYALLEINPGESAEIIAQLTEDIDGLNGEIDMLREQLAEENE